jgi:RimJ/RimL family protein N-acetyltransferase
MPPLPRLRDPLTDGTIVLRVAAERDIPETLIAYQDDPQLHIRLGEERPPSGAELGRRNERAEEQRNAGRSLELTVLQAGSDTCVGMVGVHKVDWENARADLGIWLAPQTRGRGYAPRALRLFTAWLFQEAGLLRVQLLTQPDNKPMIAAARAVGFQFEGVLREYTRERGARVDLAVLSLLPSDL